MKGLIISGGSVDERLALAFFQKIPHVIAADRGLQVCRKLGIPMEEAVGDFDSISPDTLSREQITPLKPCDEHYLEKTGTQETETENVWEGAAIYRDGQGTIVRALPPMKDWTDTDLAVHLGIEKGWSKIYVLGGTGTRLDHVIGNLQVMEMALENGCAVVLADPHNRIRMIDSSLTLSREKQWGHYVSLIPWGGPAEGLTLQGFVYNVKDYTMTTDACLGVSNRIAEETARITLRRGKLLVIESED